MADKKSQTILLGNSYQRALLGLVCGCLMMGIACAAYAQDRADAEAMQGPRYQLDVRGLALQQALERLVDSTRISLVYDVAMVAGKRATCRAEEATAEALLHCVLSGTGLAVERRASGTFVLRKADPGPSAKTAQSRNTISGFVYDAESGRYLPGAAVYEAARQIGTTTNTAGYYHLGVSTDSVRLAFSHLGYQEARLALKLRGATTHDVGLNPALVWLDSLSVVAEREGDDDHPTQGRALYGHVRGFYLGVVGPSTIAFTSRDGLLLGYRLKGRLDLGLFFSIRSDDVYIVGPALGFSTRPSRQGWGARARLIYRIGLADRDKFGDAFIVQGDTTYRSPHRPDNLGRDTSHVAVLLSERYAEPGLLGVAIRDLGLDAEVSIYKRYKLGPTTEVFPSAGLFVASSTSHVFNVGQAGVQLALPVVLGISGRTRLVLEPIFRLSLPRLDGRPRDGWSVDLRLNL